MIVYAARKLNKKLNSHTGKIFLMGLSAVLVYNWHLWQKDKQLAERLRKEHQVIPVLSRTPKVSVLVAAWNEAAIIGRFLESLLASPYPELEIIICAGGSDQTLEIARRYLCKKVTIIEQ